MYLIVLNRKFIFKDPFLSYSLSKEMDFPGEKNVCYISSNLIHLTGKALDPGNCLIFNDNWRCLHANDFKKSLIFVNRMKRNLLYNSNKYKQIIINNM